MDHYQYQVGGCLSLDAPSYVTTIADQHLYRGLKAREFCYVFDAPNSGKSSLKEKVQSQLVAEGFSCVTVDLNQFNLNCSEPEWNKQLVNKIVQDLELNEIESNQAQSEKDRQLIDFFNRVLEATGNREIVIFIDAIEQILKQDQVKKKWLEAIAYCYLQRETSPQYSRLNFCLLGVASVNDLETVEAFCLFEIGREIRLPPWTIEQMKPLAIGIAPFCKNPRAILEAILAWTNGQPLFTQKLCQKIAANQRFINQGEESIVIGQLVGQLLVDLADDQVCSQHLQLIHRYLIFSRRGVIDLLFVYLKLLHYNEIPLDNSPLQQELQLVGIATQTKDTLKIYNRIYARLFDYNWADQQIQALRSRSNPFAQAYQGWLKSGGKEYSWLLRGEALTQAQQWAKTKKLTKEESQFLNLSEQWEKREVQTTLELAKIAVDSEKRGNKLALHIQQEIKRLWLEIEQANQDLHQISRQNRWFILTAMAAIALLTVIGTTRSLGAVWLTSTIFLCVFLAYLFKYDRVTKHLQKNINIRKNLIASFENFWQTSQYAIGYSNVSLTELLQSNSDISNTKLIGRSKQSTSLIILTLIALSIIFFGLGYVVTSTLFNTSTIIIKELAEPILPFITLMLVVVAGLMGLLVWLFLQRYKQSNQENQTEISNNFDLKYNNSLIKIIDSPYLVQLKQKQEEIEQKKETKNPTAIESKNGRNSI